MYLKCFTFLNEDSLWNAEGFKLFLIADVDVGWASLLSCKQRRTVYHSVPAVNIVVILIAWNLETLWNTACQKAKETKLVQRKWTKHMQVRLYLVFSAYRALGTCWGVKSVNDPFTIGAESKKMLSVGWALVSWKLLPGFPETSTGQQFCAQ